MNRYITSDRLLAPVGSAGGDFAALDTGIRAAIWENDTTNVKRHNATLSRIYKDGEVWKDSTSFGREDLPLVMKVADRAHDWIYEHSHSSEAAEDET